jgi:hypothetical protein
MWKDHLLETSGMRRGLCDTDTCKGWRKVDGQDVGKSDASRQKEKS